MTKGESTPLLSPTYPPPPYHYVGAKLFLALFNPPEDAIQDLLPDPLKPSQMPLAGLMFGEMPCKETGTFMETGMLVQCVFDNPETKEEEVGVYFAYNYVDTDVAQAAGREIWGYPRKLADISLRWRGDVITGTAKRDGITLWKAKCRMEDEGAWIDSGPNINTKVIPSVTGKGFDIAVLTAAYLEYTVKNGRSGEVEFEIQSGPRDNLDPIKIDTPMIGQYFDCDILVPPGKVIVELKL
ncbi:MAG: acetoacetate decarboxylase family protein [Candidatus Thorarchaeota archaeon]|jgi:acetoacetate decarboxylase